MVNATIDNTPVLEYFTAGLEDNDVRISIGTQEDSIRALLWNDTGTAFYITGTVDESFTKFNVFVPYDLSTASYSGSATGLSTEDGSPANLNWNNDGTKMYMLGGQTSRLYEYDVVTPYDVAISYTGKDYPFSENNDPQAIKWFDNGSKLIMVGASGASSMYEYTATTPYDVSTLSYTGKTFDIGNILNDPRDMAWNNDGTKVAIADFTDDMIYTYTLSTPYDISTLSYTGNSVSVTSNQDALTAVSWNDTGTKLYTGGYSNDELQEYNTTPFNIGKQIVEVPAGEVWKGEVGAANIFRINGITTGTSQTLVISGGDIIESDGESGFFSGFKVSE